MKIENGKIVQATEDELYSIYLSREWFEIMPFDEFKERWEAAGTKVIEKGGAE